MKKTLRPSIFKGWGVISLGLRTTMIRALQAALGMSELPDENSLT